MSTMPSQNDRQADQVPRDLTELAEKISALPAEYRSQLEPCMARVLASTGRRRRILTLVQEALSQLRLDMKYLMFDLEATRRERDALQEQHKADDQEFDG